MPSLERARHRPDTLAPLLVGGDRRAFGKRQGDVIEPAEQPAADLAVDREGNTAPGEAHLLASEVDLALAGGGERAHIGLREDDGEQADLRAVGVEDVAEAGGDDRAEPVVLDRPRRVLARGAAAEIAPARQDRVARKLPAGLLRPVVEEELAEAGALDPLEERLGDDLIRVDVGAVQVAHRAGNRGDWLHAQSQVRMSTKCPSIAAAAAISGETRWVRPPRPWRPSKLRFEVEAQRSPGARMSGFIPRHIEQPATRQSKPPARNTSSRPSASACALTCWEPGTTIASTPGATLRPCTTCAAARRSPMRE